MSRRIEAAKPRDNLTEAQYSALRKQAPQCLAEQDTEWERTERIQAQKEARALKRIPA